MALIKSLHLLRYFHIVIDHEKVCVSREKSKQQAFSTVFKSHNERKRERRVGSICTESNSSPAGKFYTHIREKRISLQVCLIFIYPRKVGCIFQKKSIIVSSKYFDLDCVFVLNRAPRNNSRTSVIVWLFSLSQPRFQTKTTS